MNESQPRFKEYGPWWENFCEKLFEAPFKPLPQQEAKRSQGNQKPKEHESA